MSRNGKEGRYRTIFKGSSIECVITDLRPHTQYHIRVQAILKYLNLKGCASDVVAFMTQSCEPDLLPQDKLQEIKQAFTWIGMHQLIMEGVLKITF